MRHPRTEARLAPPVTPILACVAVLWLLWVPSHGAAATYYVSRADGSSSFSCAQAQLLTTPRLTIGSTLTSGAQCLAAGDTLFIRGGMYPESVDFPPNKSGTSDNNRTLISAYNQEPVIIKPGSGSFIVGLSSPSATRTFRYLTFDGLILDGTGASGFGYAQADTFGAGFIEHNMYRNGEVRNTHLSGMSGLNQYDEVHHMRIHDNGLTNAYPQSHGLYACAMDARIHDNAFYHNGAYGLQYYYSGGGATGCASRTKIYNNTFSDNAAITLSGAQTSGAVVLCCGDSVEFFNNLVYNNGRSGSFPGHGLTVGYSGPNTNLKIYNNTFYNNKNTGLILMNGVAVATVKNNIFFANGGVAFSDLSGVNSPLATSNMTTDPLFTNAPAGNFTPLAGSNAIDTGDSTVPTQATDINGNPRVSGSKIDRGPIEVQQGGTSGPSTFYVAQTGGSDSANDCLKAQSPATPKATVAAGLACITAGGSTLLIKNGTYPEMIDTGKIVLPGGTDYDHATTIAAFGNDVVTLQMPGPGVGLFFKDATNSHYFILDRLIIDGQNRNGTNGFACMNGAHHIRFQNGEIKNTYFEPVYINNGNNCEILNSTVHDWLTLFGIHALGSVSGTIVRGTQIHHGPGSGLKLDANETGTAISGVVIEQNSVHDVGTGGSLAALLLGGTGNSGLVVRNNLLYDSYRGIEIVTGTPSAKVLNNTVSRMASTGIQINAGAVTTQVKNNISVSHGGTAIADASGSMVEATNLRTDPNFVNAAGGDFQLQSSSPAIDLGTNLAPDVVFDFLGVTRSNYRASDIGAYEFTGTVSVAGDILGPRRTGGSQQGRGMFQVR